MKRLVGWFFSGVNIFLGLSIVALLLLLKQYFFAISYHVNDAEVIAVMFIFLFFLFFGIYDLYRYFADKFKFTFYSLDAYEQIGFMGALMLVVIILLILCCLCYLAFPEVNIPQLIPSSFNIG